MHQHTAGSAVAHQHVEPAVDQKGKKKKKKQKKKRTNKACLFRDAALCSIQRNGIFHFSGRNS